MIDEMDLLSGLKTVDPVRPPAYDQARAVLRAAMAVDEGAPEPAPAARRRARWATRRTVGFGAAALTAAAAAVALVAASLPAPGHHPAAAGHPAPNTAPAAANPVLTQLAATITVPQVTLPGNATLEIRNQSPASATPGANGYDLYLDNGTYYWGYDQSDLLQVIASGQDTGQGAFKRSIAAALVAAKGDVATGRAQMSVANFIPGSKPNTVQAQQAEIEKLKAIDKQRHVKYTPPKPLTAAQKAEQTDNLIWMNSNYALTAAPENPNVRAGVLRILATMPHVTVTHTTTAGQSTLTLSDSWPLLSGDDTESTVINARTGLPIATFDRGPGQPSASTYYHATRVTLAEVEAGKF
ncbi:MAG: hypothetical protein JO016_16720 [Actinobacteria bacterium]|nr:hypothetical protein [Actinomycetota bacterium]